ncbi:MAG: tRNA (N6-isopentenyl adenosine(37)-C2)-methylthiotransferase MiaB [Puniceicoccales bacterium]|nr:tRNA (N6-isopentenyl adenosine(37)-C2)-methylthiotransferase MiaB [Puniceicoccales bacterium]
MKQPLKVFIKTYGCQMNGRDSEMISAQLRDAGHEVVSDENVADVAILNTCSVREQAEIRALGKAGHLSRRKRTNPNFKIGIIGCMAENLGAEFFQLNSDIDFAIGPRRLNELVEVVENQTQDLRIGAAIKQTAARNFGHITGKCTAFISIAHGCNRRCSYCIVPKTRGREIYRPMDAVLAEAKFLAENGTREITLLGQTVNGYGVTAMPTLGSKTPFVQLLEKLDAVNGIERIRYMSPHPQRFSDDLIFAHKDLPKLCPSVHLPVQSGSNRVLRAMGRPYTVEKILQIVEKLRDAVPRIGISTDIIVGYPGETGGEFEETVALFDAAKFNMAFIFKYSPRVGTKSAMLADDVPDVEKERRNQILLKRVEECSLSYNEQFIGQTVEVLAEGNARRGEGMVFGWTPNHCKVLFKAPSDSVGQIVSVRVEGCATTVLVGTLIDR